MRRLLLFFGLAAFAIESQAQLRINEISQGVSGSQDFVEFVVTGTRTCTDSTADLRGIIFDDNPGWYGTGSVGIGCLRFDTSASWSAVKYGSIIVVFNEAERNTSIAAVNDSTDVNGDGVYILPGNSSYLDYGSLPASGGSATFNYNSITSWVPASTIAGAWGAVSQANAGDAVLIVNPLVSTTSAVHSVAYGSVTGGVQTPNIYFSANGTNTVYYHTGGTPATQSAWTSGIASATQTPGAGNNANNIAWISAMSIAPTGTTRMHVDSSVAFSGSGLSWATAKKTVAEALAVANSGPCINQVWVKKGTYFPTTDEGFATTSRDSAFRILRNGVAVYGGFGNNDTTLATRNITTYPTILSGDIGALNDSNDNSYHVVTIIPAAATTMDSSTKLDGFTVTLGRGVGAGADTINGQVFNRQDGGGILLATIPAGTLCTPVLRSVTIRRNSAAFGGGFYVAAYNTGIGSPYLFNCSLANNRATNTGGGAFHNPNTGASTPRYFNCTFTANTAPSSGGVHHAGSGVYDGCTFTGNSATSGAGGGINRPTTGVVNFNNTVFTGNTATTTGGAVYQNNGIPASFNLCTFTNNAAASGGAIYTLISLTADSCTFTANRATAAGGGLVVTNGATATVTFSTFTDCNASSGAAVETYDTSTTNLTDCRFSLDSASFTGGVMRINGQATVNATSCEFFDNYSATVGAVDNGVGVFNARDCIFSGNKGTLGGAINNYNGGSANVVTVTNSVFAGNQAYSATGDGGAIHAHAATTTNVTNCTFSENTTVGTTIPNGNAISADAGAIVAVRNSILWGAAAVQAAGSINYSYSNVRGVTPTATNLNANPLFVNAANPDGADNIWATADDGLKLQLNSPSRNTGSNALVPSGVITDITGAGRFVQTVDMGAYEGPEIICPGGTRIYVDSSIAVSGNGTSWLQAFKTVSEALDIANACTTINEVWVAKGTYYPMVSPTIMATSRDSSLRILRNGIKLYGGFAGGETLLSARNIAANLTSLSGNIGSATDSADNSHHVITVVARPSALIDTTTVVDGFTITRGNANATTAFAVQGMNLLRSGGGGILLAGMTANNNCSPLVENCTFTRNRGNLGAGLYGDGTTAGKVNPVVRACAFVSNFASVDRGGGLYCYAGSAGGAASPTITASTFTQNVGVGGAGLAVFGQNGAASTPAISSSTFIANNTINGGGGGGIAIEGGLAPGGTVTACSFLDNRSNFGAGVSSGFGGYGYTVTNCTFTSNRTTTWGGAAEVFSTTAVAITGSTFTNNSGPNGGAIYQTSGNLIVDSSAFTADTAYDAAGVGGAIRSFSSGLLQIKRSAFTTNKANAGGAVHHGGGPMLIASCTFTADSASLTGGAVRSESNASDTIRNCFFFDNRAGTDGGAISMAATDTLSVFSSVFKGNTAGSGSVLFANGSVTLLTNCVADSNTAGLATGTGGAVRLNSGNVFVSNSTFSNNATASTSLPAANTFSVNTGRTLTLNNSIVWGAAAQHVAGAGTVAYSFSDVKGVAPTATNFSIDPPFVNATDGNGADNIWATADDGLHLKLCSPLINAGSNALIPAGVTSDITGAPRIQFTKVDLGAYEHPFDSLGGPSVTVAASTTVACQGAPIVFTATVTNGGTFTTQWYLNGAPAGPNSTTYSSPFFQNGDSVYAVVVNTDCNLYDTSNGIELTIIPSQLRVDASVPASGTGLSWASPLKTLDEALDIANLSTTCPPQILVKQGTYYPMTNPATVAASRDSSLRILRNGIQVYGGFGGNDTTFATRNPALHPTILSGDIGNANDSADNSYHVVTILASAISNIDTTTVLDGFIVTRGNADVSTSFAVNGTTTFRQDGGGILTAASAAGQTSAPLIQNCTVTRNYASFGGGIYCAGYSSGANNTVVRRCTITANRGIDAGGYQATSMGANGTGNAVLDHCIVTGNTATGRGGGVSVFNTGGGSAVLTANACFVQGNSAVSTGGGAQLSSGTFNAINTVFEGNTTTAAGAAGGGGVYVAGVCNLRNCTFSNNTTASTANPGGAGVYALSGITNVYNTIAWGAATPQAAGNGIGYYNSDVRGIATTLNIDPLFINPADPDGTDNVWATTDDGLRVDTCSPVLNAGNNTFIAGFANDITGTTARILNATVDMGAYEHPYSFAGFPDVTVTAAPQPACVGAPITFTAAPQNVSAPVASYQWYRNSTVVQSGLGATFTSATLANADTVWVILTNTDCGYFDTSNRVVVVIGGAPPAPGTITGNSTPCAGAAQTYAVSPVSGATSYTWTTPTGWIGTSTTASLLVTVGTASGNVTVTANTTCGASAPASLAVTVATVPAAPGTITGSQTPCVGSAQTYTVTPVTGATSYTWTTPGAGWNGASTSATLGVTAGTAAGNITVSAVNVCGASAAASSLAATPVSIPAQPGAITGNAAPCAGTSQTYSVATVPGATTYNWSLPTGWTTTGSITNSITVTPGTAAGTISVTAANLCGPSATASTLAVTPSGISGAPGAISGASSICSNTQNTYSIAPVANALAYNWSTPPGWTGTSTTNTLTTTASASSGLVSVTVTNTCGTSAPSTLAVTVTTPPTAPGTITGPAAPCVGTPQSYSITPVAGATSYTWTTPGTGWAGTSSTAILNATVGTVSGNITVAAVNGCGTSAASSFAVAPNNVPAQPGTIAGPAAPCIGVAATYSIGAVANATSYTWTVPAGWAGGTSATTSVSTTPTAASGNVTVVANNVCGSGPATLLAVAPITTPAQPGTMTVPAQICQGIAGTYSVPNVASAASYTWTLPPGWSGSSTSSTILATPNTTSGTISVTAMNACGTSPARTAAVTVTQLPSQPSGISGPNAVCAGTAQTYTTAGAANATSYAWTLPPGWSGASSTGSILATVGGSGTISLTATNVCGTSAAVTLPVTVNPLTPTTASITATTPTTVCPGVPVSFTAAVTGGGATPSYTWTRNGTVQAGITGNTFTVSNPVSGDVIGFSMASGAVCPSPATAVATPITITVLPPVVPGININTQFSNAPVVCAGTQLNFFANIVGGGTAPVYQWWRNGIAVGTAAPTYSATNWTSGETVYARLSSNAQCATPATINSNVITVTVSPTVAPTVFITASPGTTFVQGQTVTFTANITGGGPAPTFEWMRNGQVLPGVFGPVYATSNLTGNDTISVRLTSGDPCASPATAMADPLVTTMTPTAVAMIAGATGISLYPNPNDGRFTLAIQGSRRGVRTGVEVLNALGQVVYFREVITDRTEWTMPIELTDVGNCIYLLRLRGEDGSIATMRFEVRK